MQGLNSVILMGRVGNDPDLRQTAQGVALCRFRMATNRSRRQGETWVEETDWHDVVLWEEQAERVHRRLGKGDLCTVEGRLATRAWTDGEGKRHTRVEVVGQRVGVVNSQRRPREEAPAGAEADRARAAAALPTEVEVVETQEPEQPF